jgi:hypothetical protein
MGFYGMLKEKWLGSGPVSLPSQRLLIKGCSVYLYNPNPYQYDSPRGLRVFLHGAGNDALFDNDELFTNWLLLGYKIISLNLPGHGAFDTSILHPENAVKHVKEILEILVPYGSNIPVAKRILVGESLGAVFALEMTKESSNGKLNFLFAETHLLAYPLFLKLRWYGLFWEIVHFFGFQVWGNLNKGGLWNSIPAFGSFKRKIYPVRTNGYTALETYGKIIDKGRVTLEEICTNPDSGKIIFVMGRFDGITPSRPLVQFIDKKLKHCNIVLKPTKATHLSIKKWYGYTGKGQ